MSKIPHFLHNRLINGGEVVSLRCQSCFVPPPPGILLVLISVRNLVNPRAIVRLEVLGKKKKKALAI
jgi:hypothetical protein